MNKWDLQACHPLSKLYSELHSLAVIVRFLHLNVKDTNWGRKYMLNGKTNPKNFLPIVLRLLRERLTKADSDFFDYA